MKSREGVSLSLLIVEDADEKLRVIVKVIDSCAISIQQTVVKDQISAQQLLLSRKFDLMILDMQLPIRSEDMHVDPDSGINILSDLFLDDNYKMPSSIIALTEFENLEKRLRDEFPDVAVLRFDSTSEKWIDGLKRRIMSGLKSKVAARQVVYCEGTDVELYRGLDLPEFEFRGLADSRAIYLAVKNEKHSLGLRDRDFLTNAEIARLKKEFPNYFVLEYYSIENYLYHPDNIFEIREGYDREGYINDVSEQVKSKLMDIVQDYKLSRNGYIDLTDNGKKYMDTAPEGIIVKLLQSAKFEDYYVYFDMAGKKDPICKKSYSKLFLEELQLTRQELAKTAWFKKRIVNLLTSKS